MTECVTSMLKKNDSDAMKHLLVVDQFFKKCTLELKFLLQFRSVVIELL